MGIEDEQHADIVRGLSDEDFSTILRMGRGSLAFGLPEKKTWSGKLREAFNDRVIAIAKSTGELSRAIFPPSIVFEGIEFQDTINFMGAEFFGVQINDVKFFGPVLFQDAVFRYPPLICDASFFGFVDFSRAEFLDPFGTGPQFWDVNFHHNCMFENVKFSGKISFERSKFKSRTVFNNCRTMHGERVIPTEFYFTNVEFTRVPWFQNVEMGQDSSVHRASFLKKFSMRSKHEEANHLPPRRGSRSTVVMHSLKFTSLFAYKRYKNKYWSTEENASRVLRLAMEGIRNRQAEGVFHALELDARRQRPSTPWHQRCLLGIYNHVSQCGQSIFRPLAFLCFFFLAFMLWFKSAFAMCSSGNDALSSLDKGFKFAFQSIVPFYAQIKGKSASLLMIPDETLGCYLSFHIVSLLESLIAAGCLAMSIIALRWHLRRG